MFSFTKRCVIIKNYLYDPILYYRLGVILPGLKCRVNTQQTQANIQNGNATKNATKNATR